MIDLKGKVVVVTGGAGFVGMSLVKLLVALEARVYILDNFSRDPGKTRLVKGASYSKGPVGDDASHLSTVRGYFRGAYAVFNLAASVGGIMYNIDNQLEMLEKNIALQVTPVLAAAQLNVPNFLQVSSVCAYSPEVQDGNPVSEHVGIYGPPQDANKGYALAKRIGEEAALMSGIPNVVVVRPSNVAGPGDYYDDRAHVIPALVRRAIDDEALYVYGNREATREFIHPFDVASGMVAALTKGRSGEVYNIGNPGNVISIADLSTKILSKVNPAKHIVFQDTEAGDMRRTSDISKLSALGWTPRFDLDKIIEDEINGY